ncbi:hypothetical protein IPM65_03675 [Candidatus Roizmanbacteria bacterium]|nr:MAG: hypothetical protein IPM65_03675 [Candidatus Roizmanbacteria bacterium]
MQYYRSLIPGIFAVLVVSFSLPSNVIAQKSSFTVATNFEIEGTDIRRGMIVTNNGNTITITTQEYDPNMFGVVTEKPAISLGQKDVDSQTYPVATSGKVPVLVTDTNGLITKGDYITSSTERGVGMKVTEPGRVLGIALESMNESADGHDLIMVSINYETVSADSLGNVGGGGSQYNININGQDDSDESVSFLKYVKYISAGLIAVISFTGSIIYYIQISKKEVEALGRNPLASKIIHRNMLFHGLVMAVMCAGGLAMAYAVLQL